MKNYIKEKVYFIIFFIKFFIFNNKIENKTERKDNFRDNINYLCKEYIKTRKEGIYLLICDKLKGKLITYKNIYNNIQTLLIENYLDEDDYLQSLQLGIYQGIINRDMNKGDYYQSIFLHVTKELRKLEYQTSKECLNVNKCEIKESYNVKYEENYDYIINQDNLKTIMLELIKGHKYQDSLYFYIIGKKKKAREIKRGINFKNIIEKLVFNNKELFRDFI